MIMIDESYAADLATHKLSKELREWRDEARALSDRIEKVSKQRDEAIELFWELERSPTMDDDVCEKMNALETRIERGE